MGQLGSARSPQTEGSLTSRTVGGQLDGALDASLTCATAGNSRRRAGSKSHEDSA